MLLHILALFGLIYAPWSHVCIQSYILSHFQIWHLILPRKSNNKTHSIKPRFKSVKGKVTRDILDREQNIVICDLIHL